MEDRSPKTSLLRPQNRSERGTIEPDPAKKMLSATTVRSDLEMEEGEERERESEDCILRERVWKWWGVEEREERSGRVFEVRESFVRSVGGAELPKK